MTHLDLSSETPPPADGGTPAPTPPPRRSPGHRGQDVRDTVAELAARAHAISLEAGSKMASALKDVINAASGVSNFAVESARDLVQYFVRRGQMTQEEGEKLLREAEEQSAKRGRLAPPRVDAPKKPAPLVVPKAAIPVVTPPKVAAPPAKALPAKAPPPPKAEPMKPTAAPKASVAAKPAPAQKASAPGKAAVGAKGPAKPAAKAAHAKGKPVAAHKPGKTSKPAKKVARKK